MTKILEKLRNQIVKRFAHLIRVELIVRVFAYLLEGAKRALAHRVSVRVELLTESGQQLGPRLQTILAYYCGDENANGGANQLTWIAYALKTLTLNELFTPVGKFVKERFGIVFKYETTQ